MITKMLLALFPDSLLFEFTDFVRFKRSYGLKGVRNLFDLSTYSTYPVLDLSGVFPVHKAVQTQGIQKCASSPILLIDICYFFPCVV